MRTALLLPLDDRTKLGGLQQSWTPIARAKSICFCLGAPQEADFISENQLSCPEIPPVCRSWSWSRLGKPYAYRP
jgi:hypothetical protein